MRPEICRFQAVQEREVEYLIDPIACEGCAVCYYECPSEAIRLEEPVSGQWLISNTPYGPLVHAQMRPAQENSGKLVTIVKQQARQLALAQGRDLIIVDGPPGIGCPVIAATAGADLALLVTAPTVAGLHDLERILSTAAHFGVPALVCINKHDLNPEMSRATAEDCAARGLPLVGSIPFERWSPRPWYKGGRWSPIPKPRLQRRSNDSGGRASGSWMAEKDTEVCNPGK